MKNLIISAALLVAMSAAGIHTVRANDEARGAATVTIESSSRKAVYNLIYKSAATGMVRVTISNASGRVIMVDEILATGSFLRPYNFIGQPEGAYTLTIADRNGKTEVPLEYKNEVAIARPIVAVKPVNEAKYELSVTGTVEPVVVNIYDAASNLVYSDQITLAGSYSRVYNLSKLKAGNITFEVVDQNGVIRTAKF